MKELMTDKAVEVLSSMVGEDSPEKFLEAIETSIESNKNKILGLQGEIQAYNQLKFVLEKLLVKWKVGEIPAALRGLTIGNQSKNEGLPTPAEMKAETVAKKKTTKKTPTKKDKE